MTYCLCVFDYASDRLNQHEGRDNLAKMTLPCTSSLIGTMCSTRASAKAISLKPPAKQIVDFLKDAENWGRKMGFV